MIRRVLPAPPVRQADSDGDMLRADRQRANEVVDAIGRLARRRALGAAFARWRSATAACCASRPRR